ncbi:MAG: hypothetical protein K6E79_05900 [Pseudobutyrivibrio sp.]|nr:hypothetical protein [Pseudobutyrivibrio sp.]
MKKFKRILSTVLSLAIVVTLFATNSNAITADAAGVAIGGVVIQGSDVVVATSGTASSEDGAFHLVASDANQNAPAGTDVAQVPVANGATFTVPLGKNTAASLLFKKFTICVMKGGALSPVSNSMFITNPEGCATVAAARMDYGKKGIMPALDVATANKNQPRDLGCQQVTLTLPLSWISNGGGAYSYNGQVYHFETAKLSGYDYSVRKYNNMGCQVTVIIVVDQAAQTEFINPYSYDGLGAHNYYGLNGATTEGLNILGAAASFLANRWSGRGFGQVDNFIIGNEVNAWTDWNYMNCGSLDAFTQQYTNAFRVMYNGIKSENASANVYVCTDQQWNKASASFYYSGKSFLTKFNTMISSTGNIDWRLATHAYMTPLTSATPWASTSNLTHSQNSPFISLQNIEVVTDFLSQPAYLSPTGAVRTVKLSEQGYTSLTGEQYQAAAVVYAYLVAMNNSHIDGLIISREKDEPVEIAQGLANGLCNVDGSKKMSYSFYQNAGDPNIIAQANAIAGVDLNTLIQPR